VAVASGAGVYFWQGKATGILAIGFGFFVAWVISNLLLELPDPQVPTGRASPPSNGLEALVGAASSGSDHDVGQ
jgi:hypothetical protein